MHTANRCITGCTTCPVAVSPMIHSLVAGNSLMVTPQGILAYRFTTDRTIMDLSEIRQHYPAIRAAANDLLGLLGPGFTNTADIHVETDISAAASLAGL